MSSYFLDTSALAKRYHSEIGTPDVDHLFQTPSADLLISALAAVEIRSAFAIKVRTHEITETDFRLLLSLFQKDVAKRLIHVAKMAASHFEEAARLIEKYSPHTNLRTLDSIQLAVALDLQRQINLSHFVSADTNLCAVAQAE